MSSKTKKKEKKKHETFADKVMKRMGQMVFLKPAKLWLDSGSRELNKVIGSSKLGLPAGKMYEIQGKPHAGKTSITMFLAALAQKMFNAFVIWVDLENSLTDESEEGKEFYNAWAAKFRLDTSENCFYRAYPKVLVASKIKKKGKKVLAKAGDMYIQAAESLFDEVETAMKEIKSSEPDRPIFVALDSVANIQTALSSGTHEEKNMRTNLDRAIFLSGALPKWQTLAFNFTAWVFFINQIRTKQGVVFGDPTYSPGGNALEHNAHVRIRMKPVKKGVVMDENNAVIGVRGSITNIKNKSGGGSKMYCKCGYKADFKRHGSKMWKFFDIDDTSEGE